MRRAEAPIPEVRMAKHIPTSWMDMRRDWPLLTAYQRFESVVAFVLTVVIAAVRWCSATS